MPTNQQNIFTATHNYPHVTLHPNPCLKTQHLHHLLWSYDATTTAIVLHANAKLLPELCTINTVPPVSVLVSPFSKLEPFSLLRPTPRLPPFSYFPPFLIFPPFSSVAPFLLCPPFSAIFGPPEA